MTGHSLLKTPSLIAIALYASLAQAAASKVTIPTPPAASQQEKSDDSPAEASAKDNRLSSTSPTMDDFMNSWNRKNETSCESQNQSVDTRSQAATQAQSEFLTRQQEYEKNVLENNQKSAQTALAQATIQDKYQAQVRALTSKLDIDKQAIQSETAKNLAALRKEAIALDDQVNQAKAQLRSAASAIDDAENDKEVQCRTLADKAGTDEEAKINKQYEDRLAKIAAGAIYKNNEGTALAGADKRREVRKKANIQNAYLNAYKNCLSGTTGPGAAAAANQAKVKRAFDNAEKEFNDKIGSYNKAMEELKVAMNQAEQDGLLKMNAKQQESAANLDMLRAQVEAELKQKALEITQLQQNAALGTKQAADTANALTQALQLANFNLSKATYNADACAFKASNGNPQVQSIMAQYCKNAPSQAIGPTLTSFAQCAIGATQKPAASTKATAPAAPAVK